MIAAAATTTELAPAKINLALHVTGKRRDGYHLLDSLVAFSDWGDSVSLSNVEERPEGRDKPRFELAVDGPMAKGIPIGSGNLVFDAIAMMVRPGDTDLLVSLTKRLPHAAGIGGGSSDAAAALRAMARLRARDLPAPEDVLRLGADVPVCLHGRCARMRGIGEMVVPTPPLPPIWAVLANPGVAVPTPEVFARLATTDGSGLPELPDSWASAAALIDWLRDTRNDLEAPARALCLEIDPVLTALDQADGCALARMSGSGATCFGLFDDPDAADRAAKDMAERHASWWVKQVRLN